jgi:hypothetical protein
MTEDLVMESIPLLIWIVLNIVCVVLGAPSGVLFFFNAWWGALGVWSLFATISNIRGLYKPSKVCIAGNAFSRKCPYCGLGACQCGFSTGDKKQ